MNYKNFDIEKQNEHLERLMQERRERVEKWRLAQKSQGLDGIEDATVAGSEATDTNQVDSESGTNGQSENSGTTQNGQIQKKKWTLDDDILDGEDDDDEDEENGAVPMDDDEDEASTLMIPKRSADAAADEDKIEKVVSVGK